MLRLLRTELVKQIRRPRTWLALGFVTLVPIIIAIALKANPPSAGGGPREGERFFELATQTGIMLPVAALRVMSRFFLVVVLCLFAGDAIASEAGWGNLRFVLVRPVGRGRLLAAKLVVAGLFGLLATFLVAGSGLLAGGIGFGFEPLSIPLLGISQSVGTLLAHLGLAVVLVWWGLAGVVAFGFMLSAMTDSSAGAIIAAVGFYIITSILDAITALGAIRYAFPTHYFDAWSDLFLGHGFTDDMWRSVLVQIPYVLFFCGIAWWWFHHKDITS